MTKCQKIAKKAKIEKKRWQKHSFTSGNYTVTHLQTLEEVPWLLRPKKPKQTNNFKKLEKSKFYQKYKNL